MRPDRPRAVERPRQVDAKIPLPQLRHLILDLTDVVERARVVDEDVDRAELLDGLLDRLPRPAPASVTSHLRASAPPHAGDLLRRRLGVDEPLSARRLGERPVAVGVARVVRLDQDVGDDDVGAGARERQRVGAAEPARAAGDEGDAPA